MGEGLETLPVIFLRPKLEGEFVKPWIEPVPDHGVFCAPASANTAPLTVRFRDD